MPMPHHRGGSQPHQPHHLPSVCQPSSPPPSQVTCARVLHGMVKSVALGLWEIAFLHSLWQFSQICTARWTPSTGQLWTPSWKVGLGNLRTVELLHDRKTFTHNLACIPQIQSRDWANLQLSAPNYPDQGDFTPGRIIHLVSQVKPKFNFAKRRKCFVLWIQTIHCSLLEGVICNRKSPNPKDKEPPGNKPVLSSRWKCNVACHWFVITKKKKKIDRGKKFQTGNLILMVKQ